MKRRRRGTAAIAGCWMLISFLLFTSLVRFALPAMAQVSQGTDQNCESLKKEIKELNDSLTELTNDIQRLNDASAEVDRRINAADRQIAMIDQKIEELNLITIGTPASLINPYYYLVYPLIKSITENNWL